MKRMEEVEGSKRRKGLTVHYLPIIGNTIEDLLHMIGGEEMTLRTTFSIGLGACDLRVTCRERNNYLIIGNYRSMKLRYWKLTRILWKTTFK